MFEEARPSGVEDGLGAVGGGAKGGAYYVGDCSEVRGKIGRTWARAEGGGSLAWLVDPRETVGVTEGGLGRNPGCLVSV